MHNNEPEVSPATGDNSPPQFLAQCSVVTLLRHCFSWLQHCSNILTLCCAKNRRCESSPVTSRRNMELKLGNKSPTEFYKPRPPRLGYHAAWAPALAILGHSEYHSANFYRCSFPIQKIVCYHDCHRNIIPFTHPFLSSSTTALGSSSPFLMSTFLFVPSRRATSIRLVPVSVQ